ncbi:MAG: redoxin domain-containing protein [Bacteroidales bacterium]|nr:redoxin domain-containing protein [Bacteroidales bacterium]
MKRLLAIFVLPLLCAGCRSENMCTIRGTVSVPDAGQPYSAVLLQGGEGIDTCRIEHGAFTLKTMQNPQVQQRIKLIDAGGNDVGEGGIYDMMEIVADTRSMTVNFDTQESSGSPLTAAMNDLIHELDKLLMEGDPEGDTAGKMDTILRQAWREHSHDAVGLQTMRLLSFHLDYEGMVTLLDEGGDFIREAEDIAMTLKYKLAPLKSEGSVLYVSVGKDGGVVSKEEMDADECLSSLTGGGGYLLLDFWASWCGPCREEIPNVIRLNRLFAAKGLKIVGVTVKDKPENSMSAMAEFGIDYDQVFDLEGIICSKYPVMGVPQFFLLDPQGDIVLKGSHNLDEFEAFLEKNL